MFQVLRTREKEKIIPQIAARTVRGITGYHILLTFINLFYFLFQVLQTREKEKIPIVVLHSAPDYLRGKYQIVQLIQKIL